ncbi:MAG: FAD:protein FMN transferase [Halarchaeum sp.]
MTLAGRVYSALGASEACFDCCDTSFYVRAEGRGAADAVEAATATARGLESQLNAFADGSAVAELNETGRVENPHVARIVERGLSYRERTGGVFDVRQGAVEHAVKAYIRGDADAVGEKFGDGSVSVDGDAVTADCTLDLNGLAKGYLVDRAAEAADGMGRRAMVDGGGDVAHPVGPVGIESPYGGRDLRVLDVDDDAHVATSGRYRRERDGTDHVYDPTTERVSGRCTLATVVAERDTTEADALATVLVALPAEDGIALVESWAGAEAFVLADGAFRETSGFDAHLA